MLALQPPIALLAIACLAGSAAPSWSPQAETPADPKPQTVVVIGASLAAGPGALLGAKATDGSEAFANLHLYPEVLEHLEPAWDIENLGHTWFFSQPEDHGDSQIEAAIALEPDVVLALDFPFWFAYGGRGDTERLAYLRKEGLDRLEQLWDGKANDERPLVLVGQLPDVRDSPVLSRSQLPGDETLKELNAEIELWIERHDNVRLVPFAAQLASLQAGKEVQIGATTYTKRDIETLLLDDRLHPSTRGASLVAALCLEGLKEAKIPLTTNIAELDVRALAENLIAAAKGESD